MAESNSKETLETLEREALKLEIQGHIDGLSEVFTLQRLACRLPDHSEAQMELFAKANALFLPHWEALFRIGINDSKHLAIVNKRYVPKVSLDHLVAIAQAHRLDALAPILASA